MQETNTEIYSKKKKKRKYGKKRYPNMSKENKQKLKKYRRNYREDKKTNRLGFIGFNNVCSSF